MLLNYEWFPSKIILIDGILNSEATHLPFGMSILIVLFVSSKKSSFSYRRLHRTPIILPPTRLEDASPNSFGICSMMPSRQLLHCGPASPTLHCPSPYRVLTPCPPTPASPVAYRLVSLGLPEMARS